MTFCRENFCGLLAHKLYTAYCPLSLQTIVEKTFAGRHKTGKFVKVFSLESFPLYSVMRIQYNIVYIEDLDLNEDNLSTKKKLLNFYNIIFTQ